jgi:hypothetical protein
VQLSIIRLGPGRFSGPAIDGLKAMLNRVHGGYGKKLHHAVFRGLGSSVNLIAWLFGSEKQKITK